MSPVEFAQHALAPSDKQGTMQSNRIELWRRACAASKRWGGPAIATRMIDQGSAAGVTAVRRGSLLAVAALVAGCSGSSETGSRSDGGALDAATSGGATSDGAMSDGATAEAGLTDAGKPDASVRNGGIASADTTATSRTSTTSRLASRRAFLSTAEHLLRRNERQRMSQKRNP